MSKSSAVIRTPMYERLSFAEEVGFKLWMAKVNELTEREFGVSVYDLPDLNFRDGFDVDPTGEGAAAFVENEVRDAVEEEGGLS